MERAGELYRLSAAYDGARTMALPSPPLPPMPPHRRLRLAGIAILVAGLLAALLVFATAADPAASGAGYRIVGGQAYAVDADDRSPEMQDLARMSGTAGVQTYRFDQWLGSLWHGRRLAATVAVLSAAVGLLCLHIAGLMREEAEEIAEEKAEAMAKKKAHTQAGDSGL
ncbi:MAG: hypothetical protein V4505_04790 [Pseudomonadota bacterium]